LKEGKEREEKAAGYVAARDLVRPGAIIKSRYNEERSLRGRKRLNYLYVILLCKHLMFAFFLTGATSSAPALEITILHNTRCLTW
jgi:hypothetical protein